MGTGTRPEHSRGGAPRRGPRFPYLGSVPPGEELVKTAARPMKLAAAAVAPGEPAVGLLPRTGITVSASTPTHEYLACSDGPAYRFVRQIAHSLMGSVWIAVRCTLDGDSKLRDVTPPQEVVIKRSRVDLVLRKVDREGRRVREDPLYEIRVLKYLSEKSLRVAGMLGVYLDPGGPDLRDQADDRELFLVLEYCSQGDLYDYITATEGRPENRFTEERIRDIFTDMCTAVIGMHSWGIIHRDLSPENFLLDSGGRAKVCDPGQAIDRWPFGSGPIPADKDVLGKNHFRAPELAERRPHDEKADVYSLGMILFLLFFLGMRPPPMETIAAGGLFDDVHRYKRTSWAPPEARELMERMTKYRTEDRLSMVDVLRSPWMAPAAARLGFPSQAHMVEGAAAHLARSARFAEGFARRGAERGVAAAAGAGATATDGAAPSASADHEGAEGGARGGAADDDDDVDDDGHMDDSVGDHDDEDDDVDTDDSISALRPTAKREVLSGVDADRFATSSRSSTSSIAPTSTSSSTSRTVGP